MWGLTTLARPTKTPPTFPSSCRPSREPFIHITFGNFRDIIPTNYANRKNRLSDKKTEIPLNILLIEFL